MIVCLVISAIFIYMYFDYIENFFLSAPRNLLWASMILLGFIGASSIFIPIPYTGIVFIISSSIPEINVLEVALFVGLGSALGEFTGWVFGYSLRGLVPRSYHGRIEAFMRLARRRKSRWLIYLILFLFALTPLPDDVVFIALGIIKFPLLKALLPCIAGKVLALGLIATAGKIFGGVLESYVGVTTTIIITLILLVAFTVIVLAIDWEKILSKIMESKEVPEASRTYYTSHYEQVCRGIVS